MRKCILILLVMLASANLFGQHILSDTSFIVSNQPYRILTTFFEDDGRTTLAAYRGSNTILQDTLDIGSFPDVSYPDFDGDDNNDILLAGFVPYYQYKLYLFDKSDSIYRPINDDNGFPNSVPLYSNPKYYYSYRATGCADLYWASKLFYIEDFRFVEVGYIFGNGCGGPPETDPMQISIYKILGNKKRGTAEERLLEQLPYLDHIPKFEDKWSFIEKYWNESYKKFIDNE